MALAISCTPSPPPAKITTRHLCRCSSVSQPDPSSSQPALTHRPAVTLPGLGNNTNDYAKLCMTLKGYGVPTVVANVSRIDWLRNAAGLVDPNYWRGTLQPRPVLNWYLKRVDEAVNEAMKYSEERHQKVCQE